MRYLGGKSKLGARIGAIIDQVLEDTGTSVVWEPFVGGNNLSRHVKRATAYVCSDANEALITMWNAVKQGWIPPDAVTEDEYMERKRSNRDPHDPLTAFMGFGCSFGGAPIFMLQLRALEFAPVTMAANSSIESLVGAGQNLAV